MRWGYYYLPDGYIIISYHGMILSYLTNKRAFSERKEFYKDLQFFNNCTSQLQCYIIRSTGQEERKRK